MPHEDFDVLIVGAGVSGIGMACALKAECPDKRFAILERRQRIGGTWDLFRYPGVRSDSDIFSYGYRRRPWGGSRMLAGGAAIRDYVEDTARAQGVDREIRYGLRIERADWSGAAQRWTLAATTEPGGERQRYTCRQLVMATGYYDHDAGYTPEFPGLGRYTGTLVHPQHWPPGLDCRGRQVVVIGSGATAVTLVPALAAAGARVTLLQRSPSYLLSLPARDRLTELLGRVLPARWAVALARRRNVAVARWIYKASRRWPQRMRGLLLSGVRRRLRGAADMRHFTPAYQPWDQRLCILPDGDLLSAVRDGSARVVTDRITGFDGAKVLLASGAALDADLLVTATGLQLQMLGGAQVCVDGEPCALQRRMFYKGVLVEGLPNFACIFGYINASWTLKVELAASWLCRLYRYMDAQRLGVAVAHDDAGCRMDESILAALSAGYVARADDRLPRQGRRAPWRVTHDYPSDRRQLLHEPIADGVLRFEPRHAVPEQPGGTAALSALSPR